MNPLWKKRVLICLLVLILLDIFLSDLIFFWGKYINYSLILLYMVVAGIRIIASVIGTIIHKIKLKKNNNIELMNDWLYLPKKRERQKKFLPIVYLLVCLLVIPTIAFGIWIVSSTFNEVMLMTKDLPYVLNKNYTKVECFIKSNDFTYQRGGRHIQYITAVNKANNEYIYINFEHEYKKIYEYSNYIIWYLPNTKLGVEAEKMP
jgi:hypothetical protein